MGKDRIKTETTAEQYVAEVIGPKIEAIEEYPPDGPYARNTISTQR